MSDYDAIWRGDEARLGEALAACIKIARNATKREKILHCGYNGWLNSLSLGGYRPTGIAASKPMHGVPLALSKLHISLPWADLKKWNVLFSGEGRNIAAVVIASDYKQMEEGKSFFPAIRHVDSKIRNVDDYG